MNVTRINAQELSSRKLWQLTQNAASDQISPEDLADVIAELARRCHDLDQLQQIDQLRANQAG